MQFVVRDDPQFSVEDNDVIYQIVINALDAMTGTTIDVPNLESKVFRLTIPAGATHGMRMRLPNQGLYHLNTSVRGNLIAQIRIDVPTKTSAEALELIEKLKQLN